MLETTPTWTFASKKPLTQWYGHVHLLADHVVGQWFCVERRSGLLLWQTSQHRANTFCGVDSGVIVASEMRSDGPWTLNFGCYGISLQFGRLLWTSHGSGVHGSLTRILGFIPGFTNELRDSPHHVENGQVFCDSGRVLDVATGQLLKKIDPNEVRDHESPRTTGQQFYRSRMEKNHPPVAIGNNLFLRSQRGHEVEHNFLRFTAESAAGEPVWSFSTEELGREIDGNFYSYRLMPPFLYLVVSDQARYRPNPPPKHCVVPNPTLWHLVTVDFRTGMVVQDFSLGDEPLEECRIEDIDDVGLLLGKSNHSIVYFRRIEQKLT